VRKLNDVIAGVSILILALIFIISLMMAFGDYKKHKCLDNQNIRRWTNNTCQEYSNDEWITIDPIFYAPPEYNTAKE
jgi:hypothetical protein